MAQTGSAGEVLSRRLSTQRLVGPGLPTAVDVVRLLTCVQSQEYAHGFWSLGMRTARLRYADVQRAFDTGAFLRTHILRPTWHFVAAEDLRWIQALTAPRVQQLNQGRYRQLGLDQHQLERGAELILAVLARDGNRTRPELAAALADGGISPEGQRLPYLVMHAELSGLVCSGPIRGAQHTYAAVADRIVPTPVPSRDQALAELTWRFFAGHGPAGVKDFTRWSSMTTADAVAGLDLVGDRLDWVEVAGQSLWFDPQAPGPATHGAGPVALLLPLYDEATLSYPQLNFPRAEGHPHPVGTDLFVGSVVLDGVNAGTWRRTVRGRKVVVETALAPSVDRAGRAAVAEAVERLAGFLGKELESAPGRSPTSG